LEAQGSLKLTKEFDRAALSGLRIFFAAGRGNCAACHAPPRFTDNSFHNIGVTQREFDAVHGAGRFAALAIPNTREASRPAAQFRQAASKAKPAEADLGYWNFVDLKTSPLRRAGESDDQFLQRLVATFKTPTLRNLRYTQPYFHDGSVHTLEEVLGVMIELSKMARAKQLRAADEELTRVAITASEVAPLVAFLNTLNEDLKQAPYRPASPGRTGH
jgi:cytochrome c peroxidase